MKRDPFRTGKKMDADVIVVAARETDRDIEQLDSAIRKAYETLSEQLDEIYNEYLNERCKPGKDVEKLDEEFTRQYEKKCAEFKSLWKEYLNNQCEVQKRMCEKAAFPLPLFPPEKFITAKLGAYRPEHYMSMLILDDMTMQMFHDMPKRIVHELKNTQLTKDIDLRQFIAAVRRKVWHLKYIFLIIFAVVCASSFALDSSSSTGITKIGENLYTAFMAFTTVGYGDLSPGNGWGRSISILLGLLGIVSISLFTIIAWTAAQEPGSPEPPKEEE